MKKQRLLDSLNEAKQRERAEVVLYELDIPIMEEVCDNPEQQMGPANATTQTDTEEPRVLCDIDTQSL